MKDSIVTKVAANDELPTFADYRPLSVSAVFALLLGLASSIVLVNPVLAIVPLIAIVMAVVALRQIASLPQGLSGKWLATSGLCLAAMFFGWGLASHYNHQANVSDRAREFADDWLRVLSNGDLPRAYQLHSAREFRQDPHSIKPPESMDPGKTDIGAAEFFTNPAMQEFVAAGPSVRFRFDEVVRQSRAGQADRIVLKYTFDGRKGPMPLWITVRRTFKNSYRAADWEIFSASDVSPDR
jgi:hypothetical protein